MMPALFVYTYLPKLNTALTQGILGTAKAPSGWQKYIARSGKTTKLEVLLYLNSLEPNRALAFSAFSQPIPEHSHKDFKAFRDAKELYKVKIAKLLHDKRVLSIYKTSDKGKLTAQVQNILQQPLLWNNKRPGKFLFSKVPHYIIAVKDGVVPPLYIEKQAALKYMQFPENEILELNHRLQQGKPVYTTRVSKDVDYTPGLSVISPLGTTSLTVASVQDFKGLHNHPFYSLFTQDQIEQLRRYKKFRLIKLLATPENLPKLRLMMKLLADIAAKYKLPLFAVTLGASITRNNGSQAVRAARLSHAKWLDEHGGDSKLDWMR